MNNRFTLNYGVRLDGLFFVNSDIKTNNNVLKYDYYGTTVDTGKWPTSKLTVSPRIGFTWDVLGDKTLKFRGGTGLFSGRLPLVFFTNMPTNSNMVQYRGILNATGANSGTKTDMNQFAGGLVTDANGKATIDALRDKFVALGHPSDINPESHPKPSAINGINPDFKMPQVWKTSLAIDYSLPVGFPLTISAEGIFNKTINAVCISDLSIPDAGGFARFNGIDNRPIFPDGYRNGLPAAYVLTNTGKGYGWSASATITARPAKWIDLFASYTHTVSKELTGMPGSDASSAFTYVPGVEGPNKPLLHNSQYVTPDRIVASLNIHDKCCNHYSLIYETWRGGYNYSYMTTNDINGDGYAYDAIYVPTDDEVANRQFRFTSEDDKNRFMGFVHADSYLSSHQGEYAEAYSVYSPWVHRVDFSYKHDFKYRGNTLQLSLDMKNVLNFFNSSWGVSKYLNPAIGSEARILKYEGVDADGYATFSTPKSISNTTETFTPNHAIGQCWYASVGVRYIFDASDKSRCGCEVVVDNNRINELIAENNALMEKNISLASENESLRKSQKVITVEKIKEINNKFVVEFAQNSSVLTEESKAVLDKIPTDAVVSVIGATSPEGSSERNTELSVERANVVAQYLQSRGIKVESAKGNEAGRVAIVTVK